MTRSEVFDALRRRNISAVMLQYSGGDDSGGVDSITYLDKDRREIKDVDLAKVTDLKIYEMLYCAWRKYRPELDNVVNPDDDAEYKRLLELCLNEFQRLTQAPLLSFYALADYIEEKYSQIPEMMIRAQFIRQNAEAEVIKMALEAPIYSRYSTFAGEYYVSGVLGWHVESNRVVMSGSTQIPNSFEEDV